MKIEKRMVAVVAAALLGLGVSAMAQGRAGSHPSGMGTPGDMGAAGGMGASGAGGMGQNESAGRAGQSGQMGQPGPMATHSNPNTVSNLLSQNTKLSSNLQTILGSGVNLSDASSGFKNLGLFVASVHISKNLGIPFSQLKSSMQSDGWNLGKAVHTIQPSLSKSQVKSAVGTAKKQAKADIKSSKA